MSERTKAILSLASSLFLCVMFAANWYQWEQRNARQEAKIVELRGVLKAIDEAIVKKDIEERSMKAIKESLEKAFGGVVDEVVVERKP